MTPARIAAIASLGVISAVLCFYGLGSNDFHERDEALHAQAALEFYENGEWWQPTVFNRRYFSKPALPVWLIAGSYHLFGPTIIATRMWAALFAIGAVLATYLLGERLGGVRVGFVAGLALATAYAFIYTHCGRTAEFDSMTIFFFVLATWLFCRAVETNRGWILCAAAAMASHSKNLAGLTPAIVFVLSLMSSRPRFRPSLKQWVACGLVFTVVNVAWMLPMTVIHGWVFLEKHIGHQVLGRPYMGTANTSTELSLIYGGRLLSGFFPWAFLGVAGLIEDGRRAVRYRDTGSVVVWCGSRSW